MTALFNVVHQLPRRVRIVSPVLKGDPEKAYLFSILLTKRAGIKHAKATPALGSVAIWFDPKQLPLPALLQLCQALLANLAEAQARLPVSKTPIAGKTPRTVQFAIEGMTCASCALLIELLLKRDERVLEANVNFASQSACVTGFISKEELFEHLAQLGYRAHPLDTLTQRREWLMREHQRLTEEKRRLVKAAYLSFPVMAIAMLHPQRRFWYWLKFFLTIPVVWRGGRPFFTTAIQLAKAKAANMDTLVALGTGAAFGYSTIALLLGRYRDLYFEAAAGIISFVQLGRYLEEKAKGQAHQAIFKLIELQPKMATRLENGQEVSVPVEALKVGDIVRVRPGERIPTDGEVIEGFSEVNEAWLTGESMPVAKRPGDKVIGGCINGPGAFTMQVTAVGAATVLAGIVQLVEQAQAGKLPIQKTVDKISSVFVPAVMGIAAFTFAGWLPFGLPRALGSAISVLLIACPCALGLATPAAILVGTGEAARRGIYIKNGPSLELAAKLSALVFDKTGTLTQGRLEVTDTVWLADGDPQKYWQWIGSAEINSEHFLARALVTKAKTLGSTLPPPQDFHLTPGEGVKAQVDGHEVLIGNAAWMARHGIAFEPFASACAKLGTEGKTAVLVALDGRPAAVIGIADQLRPGAKAAIACLKQMGIKTFIVTGDAEAPARFIARQVGIDQVVANAKPPVKLAIVEHLQQQGERVGMVGDGINDAPALAAADVSFAIGSGTEVAVDAADITLIQPDIARVVDAIGISAFTLRVIYQNLFWAFLYNTIAIPVAAFGKLNPMVAAGAMALSSVSVVANSLRLKK